MPRIVATLEETDEVYKALEIIVQPCLTESPVQAFRCRNTSWDM